MQSIIIILNNERIRLEKVNYTIDDNFIEIFNNNGDRVCISIQEISYYSESSMYINQFNTDIVLTVVLKDNFSGFVWLRRNLSVLNGIN